MRSSFGERLTLKAGAETETVFSIKSVKSSLISRKRSICRRTGS